MHNKESTSTKSNQKQITLWVAGIFTLVSLMFFGFSFYAIFLLAGGEAHPPDVALITYMAFMVLINLIGVRMIRLERLTQAAWMLFLANAVFLPIVTGLFSETSYILMSAHLIIFSSLFISMVIPKTARKNATIVAVVGLGVTAAVELWNPAFREGHNHLERFTPVMVTLALMAMLAFLARHSITGNIRTKLITIFAVVAIFSMGSVAFLADWSLRKNLTASIIESQASLATAQGFQIGQAIISQFEKLKGLAAIRTIQLGAETAGHETRPEDTAEIEQLNLAWRAIAADQDRTDPLAIEILYNPLSTQLRNFQKTFPENLDILLTDQKGFSIAATNFPTNYYQADSLWWRTAHTTGRYIGQPIFDPATNSIALDIAVPVFSYSNGEFVGVLRATIHFDMLADLLVEGLRGQSGYSLIYQPNDQEIKLRALGNGNYEIVQDFAPTDLQEFAHSPNTQTELSLDGIPMLASSALVRSYSTTYSEEGASTVNELNWRVIVVQEKSEALQFVNIQARNNLLLVMVMAIAVIVIASFLARLITHPIIQLNEVAIQIASGDLTAEARVNSQDEIGTLAATFNTMTSQLRNLIGSLEQRVVDRTHDLELAAEVGRTITEKIAKLDELLSTAVEMIRSRFDLYYTQVYLADTKGRSLILRAGTGEVGKQLLDRKHHLLIGLSSLNGQAILEKQPVIVKDTLQSATFKPNSLLPHTRSEMVVPLTVGDRVIGVLDMQSEQPNAFNETNLAAFKTLAGQLAIAIQNAALLEQAEEARAEVEAQIRYRSAEGWQDFLNAIEQGQKMGLAYNLTNINRFDVDEFEGASGEYLSSPLVVMGAQLGMIKVARGEDHDWTAGEAEVVHAASAQLAQHLENLRLLAQAKRYQTQAEQAVRRLTREGWDAYLYNQAQTGYFYDLNQVQPLSASGSHHEAQHVKLPLVVREETIGELELELKGPSDESMEIVSAVAEQLSGHIENLRLLEQNEKRAYELATVATVSTTVSTVLNPDELLQSVVNLTKERFGLYHAHIYQVKPEENALVLAAGAGEVGRQMLAEGWAIPVDHELSIIADAYRQRQTVVANDIYHDKESTFLSNRLLPDTRSEMALPLIVGEQVLGVFDVQSEKTNYFTDENINIYTTLATQVAVALQNARLYVEQAATVTQLRELDKLKSSFLANMSHELRTPLNSILGFTDVMLEGLDGALTEYMDNDLRLIQKNGQHLLHLINDVLDMAKIEAGRMNLNLERFTAFEVLDDVTSITSTLASEKKLSLSTEMDSDRDVQIYADRTRLRQVMINLVNNAIKFTETGNVSLKVASLPGARVLITVKDTGIGIAPEKLDAVFQEFIQVDSSSTRKVGGTGLGLPISRRLVEMHGGRLWAESTGHPGEGSTFFVELPIEARVTETVEKQVA